MTEKSSHLGSGSQDPPLVPGSIRLYSMRFCPYAHRVHLVLSAKEIPHDVVYINLKQKPEWFLEKMFSKVPSIIVDGESLTESLIISDFLDEYSKGRPLHSKDPIRKAKDRLLIEAFGQVSSCLYKCFTSSAMNVSILQPAFDAMDKFEKELDVRRTTFFGGDVPGMVDYMIWPWCERMQMLKVLGGEQFTVPKERFPHMFVWSQGMLKDRAVETWAISAENHAKFIKLYISGSGDYDSIL